MTPTVNSRKGKQISRAACDMCRERKVQCSFLSNRIKCDRCERANVSCTFVRGHKPRGPPSRIVEKAKAAQSAIQPSLASHPAIQQDTLDQLCSREVFEDILSDFLALVYPVLPLIHPPTFQAEVTRSRHGMSQSLSRQCLAVAAVTIASLPRKFSTYAHNTAYISASSMVAQAVRLVQISRVMNDPYYTNNPTIEHLTTSLMLSMASHYAGDTGQGWAYACEAMLLTRMMKLGEREGYHSSSLVDAELRKRAFWCGYIIQIHDRISSIAPHTGLSYLPRLTDWDYIIPLALHDEELTENHGTAVSHDVSLTRTRPPPIIGFVALIKLFRCCADLFSFGVPGSVNRAYSMASGPIDTQILPSSPESTVSASNTRGPSQGLAEIFQVFQQLGTIMDSLPTELRLRSQLQPVSPTSADIPDPFEIMRANIHITSLYLQSTILETFANSTRPAAALSSADTSDDATRVRTQIWAFRESFARELLQVLESCPPWTLEANGASMIIKVREIASTLLDGSDDEELRLVGDKDTTKEYVRKFVEILSNLDFGARRGEGAGSVTGS